MALKLGELVAYLRTDNDGLRRGLADGKREMRSAGRDMEREAAATAVAMAAVLGAGGRDGGEQFVRGADGRLRDSRGRFVTAGQASGEALGDGIVDGADGRIRQGQPRLAAAGRGLGDAAARAAASGLTQMQRDLRDVAGMAGAAAGSLGTASLVIGAVAAASGLAVPVVGALAGALAALPGLLSGIGAGAGVLGLGFLGLGDAFQETSSAGGSVVDRAYQIAQAERRVRDANREVLASQEALTRARKEAAERIGDLGRSLAGARLDEEAAVLAVADAQRELMLAQRSGDTREIQRADLAYRQAQQTLEDVRDRVGDLEEEHRDATQAGVEGSDQVRDALDRQRRAVEGVEDAEHALQQARRGTGGGGGAAAEMMRLAPSAKELVATIKALKPAWESLRLDVQQRLFRGVGGEIRALSDAWLPTLHRRLGGISDTFNDIILRFSRSARRPEFIRSMEAGLESFDRMVGRVGRSISGPFVDAWGRLTRASGPFIERLGDEIGDLVDDFSAWIESADKSGRLESFFDKASDFLSDVFAMGRDVASIIGSVMQIIFDADESDQPPWDSAVEGLDNLAAWFKDPETQEMIREWIGEIEEAVRWITEELIPDTQMWIDRVDRWTITTSEWGDRIDAFSGEVRGAFNSLIKFFDGLPPRISRATSGMWDGIKNAFRSALNWVIDKWNGFELRMPAVNFLGGTVGGGSISTPNLPHLDVGGDVVRSGLAVIHEGERVLPAAQVDRLDSGGGHAEARELWIRGELRVRGDDLVLVLRERVADGGGDVQQVIGSRR